MAIKTKSLFDRRRARVRGRIGRVQTTRPRLSVFRSSCHIYVQIIDDAKGETLAAASSIDKEARAGGLKGGSNKESAVAVGKLIASRAIAAGIKSVVFDRGGYRFHGRVKALADAARGGGLDF
jgi:large subunit ribosomal protein L18